MHDILTSVRAQLDELFAQNLRTLTGRDRKEALAMLQSVLFSEEPLGWRQLHCVLYPDADPSHSLKQSSHVLAEYEGAERLIRSRSRGRLELKTLPRESHDSTESVVQFIHESIRDFLVQSEGLQILDSTIGENPIGMSQDQMTRSCISYVASAKYSYKQFKLSSKQIGCRGFSLDLSDVYPLLKYTVNFLFIRTGRPTRGQFKQE